MIVRCPQCGATSEVPLEPATTCNACGSPVGRAERCCAVACHVGEIYPCPPGGCRLHYLLFGEVSDAADPCAVELLAEDAPDAVAESLTALYRSFARVPAYPHPARGAMARVESHAATLSRWERQEAPGAP